MGIITYFIPRVFAGFWLQEYGTAFIPGYRVIIFALLGVVSLAALAGIVKGARGFAAWASEKRLTVGIALLAIVANVLFFVYQNMFYFEPDARLLYPSVSLIAIGFMYGLKQLAGKKGIIATYVFFTLICFLDLLLIVNHNTVLPEVPWLLP